MIALAQSANTAPALQVVSRINDAVLFPLITFLLVIALIVFLFGCFQYVAGSGNETARETGRKHILWGLIGLLVMLAAYAILNIAAGTFGVDVPEPVSQSPYAPTESPFPVAKPDSRAPTVSPPPASRPSSNRPVQVVSGTQICASSQQCINTLGDRVARGAVSAQFSAPVGDPVVSVGNGTVVSVVGDQVIIEHTDGTEAVYQGVVEEVAVGSVINRGEALGAAVVVEPQQAAYGLPSNQAVVSVLLNRQSDYAPVDFDSYVRDGTVNVAGDM